MTKFTLDKLPKKVLAQIDLQTAFMASRCIVAAERLQLFRKIHGKKLTVSAIGRMTGARGFRLEVFLNALTALGLLVKDGERYKNSRLADRHYVRGRSINWTRLYSQECVEEYQAYSVLEQMLTTGKGYQDILGRKREGYIEMMRDDPQRAYDFTHMLYWCHQAEARALAKSLDLRKFHNVLDLGGGSGVMSLALARKYRHIKACVLDIEAVVRVAHGVIRRERLSRQVKAEVGDMNKKIPSGYDVVMMCDAGSHNYDLLKRIYNALPPLGMIVLVEEFSTEDYAQPFYRLMWQLRSDRMWLVTKREAKESLKKCGFKSIKQRRLVGDAWLITALKQA